MSDKRIFPIPKIIKDCIMTAVDSCLSLWMPKFIECRYDLFITIYIWKIASRMSHTSQPNVFSIQKYLFQVIWYHAIAKNMQ